MAIQKLYPRVNWADYPSTSTPFTAANLNKMDKGIDDIDDRVVSVMEDIEDEKAAHDLVLVQTLTAGSTSLVFENAAITSDSMLDLFAKNKLISPSSVSVASGRVTYTFAAQNTAISFKLRVLNIS